MRISQLLGLIILPFVSYAAKKPIGTFEKYHERFISSAPLKLDDLSYEALTTAPRDYGVAILLTALEARFGCALCRDFQPEWDILAKSWAKGDKKGESRMLYGTLDFTDGKATFQKVRCSSFESALLTRIDVDLEIVDATNCSRLTPLSPHKRPRGEV
jgi:oligosaccharyltransferase complex subunit gamma